MLSRHETLHDDEVQTLAALPVTTVARTAFDLARRGAEDEVRKKAVARLDALANATQFEIDDVAALASRHPNLSGVRLISEVLDLVDAGAQSPKETWLRLLLVEPVSRVREHKSPCSVEMAGRVTTWIWDGKRCWMPSNATANIIGRTEPPTPTTSNVLSISATWGGW